MFLSGSLALNLAVDLHFAGGNVAIHGGVLADGHLAFVGGDFTFDFAIDDHVVAETNGTGDFDTAGENVGGIGHNERENAWSGVVWQLQR